MQPVLVSLAKRLHRADPAPVRLDRERRARPHGFLVELDGARAADAVFAAEVGALQAPDVADEVGEEQPNLDLRLVDDAIDLDADVHAPHAPSAPISSERTRSGRSGSMRTASPQPSAAATALAIAPPAPTTPVSPQPLTPSSPSGVSSAVEDWSSSTSTVGVSPAVGIP